MCELQTAVDFLDGQRRPIKSGDRAKISGPYPYYGASGIVDYVNDYIFDDNLILLGEDGENILSRNLPLAFMVSGKIWVNNHAHVMKPNDSFDITYLTEYLESIDYSLLNSGTAQPKLNKQTCLKIKVIKPSKKEQTAIANVLSDTDALITKLEQLIAKKQAIRTAIMQQLLTGRTRLPQFSKNPDGTSKSYKASELGAIPEDWKVLSVGQVCDLLTGFPFSSNKYSDSGIRLLRGSNVKRGITDWSDGITQYWPEISADIKQYELYAGDIVISMDGSLVGRSFAQLSDSDLPAVLLQRVARVRTSFVDQGFLKEWICSQFFTEHCDAVKTVTAIPHISPQDIRSFKFLMPPTNEEQTAIANILSDMDAELTALEQKLAKVRNIKQGMMQQLLTGRIRLPLEQQP
ncbi:TPA: restriction endonuclease subunit S [Citrobacter koseri]|nr:restriction endonuclease subunit S [Citrobacter koseri]